MGVEDMLSFAKGTAQDDEVIKVDVGINDDDGL